MTLLQIGPAPVGAESRVPPGAPLRVLFVCMPWASLDMPSLALSTLTPLVREHRGVESVDVLYGNLRWADHVLRESGGSVGEEDFGRIVRGDFIGVGEWVFSSALRSAQSPLPAPETTPSTGWLPRGAPNWRGPRGCTGWHRGSSAPLPRR